MEHGLAGMLESSESERTDQESPFLGAVLDIFCGNGSTANSSTISTIYAQLLRELNRKQSVPCWTSDNHENFKRKIGQFKFYRSIVIEKYQALDMTILKWPMLDLFAPGLRNVRGMK